MVPMIAFVSVLIGAFRVPRSRVSALVDRSGTGGERSIATLKENAHARRVVKGMVDAGKPMAIVGDAIEMLVAAEAVRGRKVTGVETSRARVEAMGAVWSEAQLTVDGSLITASGSEDLESLISIFVDSLVAAPEGERQQAA